MWVVGSSVRFRVGGDGDEYMGAVVSVHHASPVVIDGHAEEVLPCELPCLVVDVPQDQTAPGKWAVPASWVVSAN